MLEADRDGTRKVLEEAIYSSNPHIELIETVKALVSQGVLRQDILDIFEVIRIDLQKRDLEELEDMVLEVMDLLVGWCNPDYRI
jgi:hypothetical protein